MNDLEFMNHAEQLLKQIEVACDRLNEESDVDIDNQRVGGVITLTFADRSQIVVNLQKPLHEVWMASRSGGFHFRFQDCQWRDTKGQGEFFDALSKHATLHAGAAVQFQSA